MNALFLKDLAEKTHRGLRGRIEDGLNASAAKREELNPRSR